MTTVVTNDHYSHMPWVWEPWEKQPHKPGEPPYFKVCRTRIWVHTWTTQDFTTETVWRCNQPGYVPSGSTCVYWEDLYGGYDGKQPEQPHASYPATRGTQ